MQAVSIKIRRKARNRAGIRTTWSLLFSKTFFAFKNPYSQPLTPSERVFCRPAALKNLAIHKGLSAFFRLAGQQNPSPIRHPLIMNTGSKFYAIFCSGLGAGASRRLTYVRRCGGSQKIAGSRGSETASVWFQTKLTGARRPPRGFSGFQPPVSWADFFSSQFKVLLNFFKKLRGRGAAPPPPRVRGGIPHPGKHILRVNWL